MSYSVRVKSENGNAKLEASGALPQVHFCSGDFHVCSTNISVTPNKSMSVTPNKSEHFRNTQ